MAHVYLTEMQIYLFQYIIMPFIQINYVQVQYFIIIYRFTKFRMLENRETTFLFLSIYNTIHNIHITIMPAALEARISNKYKRNETKRLKTGI